MRTHRFALVALLLSLLAPTLSATAIVVFRTPARIVLASDSMQRGSDGQRATTCKVRPSARWWLTLAGFSHSRTETTPLDVWQVVTDAIAPARTLDDVRAAIEQKVYPRMVAGLKSASTAKGFASLFEEGGWVSQIVVAGVDGTTLSVGVLGISLDAVEPFHLTPTWVVCPGRLCPDGTLYFGASVPGPTVERVTPPLMPWVRQADAAAARRIVAEQIAATPADVSPPIDILEITARGARWVQRDPSSTCSLVTKG